MKTNADHSRVHILKKHTYPLQIDISTNVARCTRSAMYENYFPGLSMALKFKWKNSRTLKIFQEA